MLFKNPSLLYGLFFLVIPIIIHLFQLRRFQKVAFTNVAFLKPLITETRKSNKLKKWLTLLARLLAIACIVLAFAQPFMTDSNTVQQEKQTAIYLDNSYSMQAAGSGGALYATAVNQLLEKLPADKVFTLFTNDRVYANTTKQQVANDLLNAGYSTNALTYAQVQLKAASLLDGRNKSRELIMISDFQRRGKETFPDTLAGFKRDLVRLVPEQLDNISIDTAFIASRNGNDLKIAVKLSTTTAVEQPITVSLNNKGTLVAKTSVDMSSKRGEAVFEINAKEPLKGELFIEDNGLKFDNHIFIATGDSSTINVLSVSDASATFLSRIFTKPDFKHTAVQSRDLNFNAIKEQNLIVLNEVKNIAPNLAIELNSFLRNGGYLVVIPHEDASGYEAINGLEKAVPASTIEKKVTTINTSHPLLLNVFSGQVDNFQYPSVSKTVWNTAGLSPILKYQDGSSFLYNKGNVYVFTAPINTDNSNFQNSPLIVPVFYNMGINSLPVVQLYYTLGTNSSIAIPTLIEDDQILNLKLDEQVVIPQQRGFNSYVLLQTDGALEQPGNYSILKDKKDIGTLSFNSPRDENIQEYFTANDLGSGLSENIDDLIYKLTQEDNVISFWKYFVMGALFFLICEMLILKYVK